MSDSTGPLTLNWSDALLLGYGPMDSCHEEFVDVVAALRAASEDDLSVRLVAVVEHLQAHFREEEHWMTATGFPARDCHADEHAAVLRSANQVMALVEQGDVSECRRLADELARWFPGHADYMDAALAHWMCNRRLGGKPVVFRRGVASA
jgi:hemerythrin